MKPSLIQWNSEQGSSFGSRTLWELTTGWPVLGDGDGRRAAVFKQWQTWHLIDLWSSVKKGEETETTKGGTNIRHGWRLECKRWRLEYKSWLTLIYMYIEQIKIEKRVRFSHLHHYKPICLYGCDYLCVTAKKSWFFKTWNLTILNIICLQIQIFWSINLTKIIHMWIT